MSHSAEFKKWSSDAFATKTSDMIADSLITMLMAGPDVSFSGSPTVSPVTAFLCAAEPFGCSGPRPPASMYFFALSHAPPELPAE